MRTRKASDALLSVVRSPESLSSSRADARACPPTCGPLSKKSCSELVARRDFSLLVTSQRSLHCRLFIAFGGCDGFFLVSDRLILFAGIEQGAGVGIDEG